MKEAYFAGGCFWCIEPIFAMQRGVKKVLAGYCGNDKREITYLEVKKGDTPFREAIRISYDEEMISFEKLLLIFVNNVDLFNKEGQFIDKGFNYTLCLYYQDEEEKYIIQNLLDKLTHKYQKEIMVSVEPFCHFVMAEATHQHLYLRNNKKYLEELVASGRNIPLSIKEGAKILIDYDELYTPIYLEQLKEELLSRGFKVVTHGSDRHLITNEGLLSEISAVDFDVIIVDLPYHNVEHLFSDHDKGQIYFARSLMRLLGVKDVDMVITEPLHTEPFSEEFKQDLLLIKEVVAELELGYVGFSNLPIKNQMEAAKAISQNLIIGE